MYGSLGPPLEADEKFPLNPSSPYSASKAGSLTGAQLAELGSQLEDLLMHVLRCEKWARFEDRLDLALAVQRATPRRRAPGR